MRGAFEVQIYGNEVEKGFRFQLTTCTFLIEHHLHCKNRH
jgi:hypothetical protein